MGLRVAEDSMEFWHGSIEACWDAYVSPHAVVEDSRKWMRERQHQVYWMMLVVGENRFAKIGISKFANKRIKQQRQNFPIAQWSMHKLVTVASKQVAVKCETSMLLACCDLIAAGEYLFVTNAQSGHGTRAG